MTDRDFLENLKESEAALKDLSWDTVRLVRNANAGLYPLNWDKVLRNWKCESPKLEIESAEDFEKKLKRLCDCLYNWRLYEPCPKCNGKRIPVFNFTQWTPFCGCSNYPDCDFRMDREGKEF